MLSRPRKEITYIIPFLIYLGIFLMSSLPASALPAKIPDIIPHFCEYSILAFFFIQMFSKPTDLKTIAIAFAGLILLGVLDELHQALIPGRVCSWKDIFVDTLGSFSGLTAFLILRRWSVKNRSNKRGRRLVDYLIRA